MRDRVATEDLGDALVAGGMAALLSGIPSTAWALARGRDPLEATIAAGSMVRPDERRRWALVAAALPVHVGLSLGWAALLTRALPARRTVTAGAVAGLAIAAVDLAIGHHRFERVGALPLGPQIADHVAYGIVVGAVVTRRRSRRRRSLSGT